MHEHRLYVIEVIKLYSNRAFGFMELGNRGTGTSNAKYIIGKTATRRKGNEMVCIQLGRGLGTLKFERVYTNQTPSITIDPNMCSYYARREPSLDNNRGKSISWYFTRAGFFGRGARKS